MLNSSDNIHHVEAIKLGPVRKHGSNEWHRVIQIAGCHLNWKDITLYASTPEALMLDHEKATAELLPQLVEA